MSEEKLSLTAVEKIQGLLLIDFFAPWCGPCRTMSPIIDEIKEEYNGKIVVE
jgi:thioredoxin 1